MTDGKVFISFLHLEIAVHQVTQSVNFTRLNYFRQSRCVLNRILDYKVHNGRSHFESVAHVTHFVIQIFAVFGSASAARDRSATVGIGIIIVIFGCIFGCILNGQFFLHSLLLLLNLDLGPLMQLPHHLLHIASAIILQQILIQNRVLVIIIKLESPSLSSAQNADQSLMNLGLHVYGQILLEVIVQTRAMVLAFKQFDIVLESFQAGLFLELHEDRFISFDCFKISCDIFQFTNQFFSCILAPGKQLDFVFVQGVFVRVFLSQVVEFG